jgi:hypothetical protein
MKKAFEITSSLSFSLPVPKSINYLNQSTSDTPRPNVQPPTEILFTSVEQRTTKNNLVANSFKGKEREMEPIEPMKISSIKGKEREIVEVSKSSKKRRVHDVDEEDGVEAMVPIIIDDDDDESKDNTNKRITSAQLNNNKAKQGIVTKAIQSFNHLYLN